MRNTVTNSNPNNHDLSVSHNPTDFRSLMNYFWNFMDSSNSEYSDLSPKIQVTEDKDAVKVTAEIPGIDEKDIDLKVSADGYLSISGEKKNESEENTKDNYFSDYYHFFRYSVGDIPTCCLKYLPKKDWLAKFSRSDISWMERVEEDNNAFASKTT